MWVEFVVGSLPCSERFFSRYSGFPLSSKTNISKFQFDQESGRRRTTMWMCYLQIVIYLFIYFSHLRPRIWRSLLNTTTTCLSCIAPSLWFKARSSAKPLIKNRFLNFVQLNKTHFYKKGFTIGLFTSNVLFSHNVTTLKNFTKFRHIRQVSSSGHEKTNGKVPWDLRH